MQVMSVSHPIQKRSTPFVVKKKRQPPGLKNAPEEVKKERAPWSWRIG
jgi:hypothetical protein